MPARELHYRWEWLLRSSPERLWPLASDTNRFNRDTGLPPVSTGPGGENGRRTLRFRKMGIGVQWEEEPFEWVRPHRFGVVRRYRTGPVTQMRVLCELLPLPQGGTRLTYQVWVRPRGVIGLAAVPAYMERSRRAFGAAFIRYDRQSSGPERPSRPGGTVGLAAGGRARLERVRQSLAERGCESGLASKLVETVASADDLGVSRLRPYALADTWGAPRRAVLELCLHATRAGLLDLRWDLLCPLCRGAKLSPGSLAGVRRQVHCDACRIDFDVSFDQNVELTFTPSPSVRAVGPSSYCIGGPQVTPHVVAQQLLAPGEARELKLPLETGRYRLRAPRIPGSLQLEASPRGAAAVTLAATPDGWPAALVCVSVSPRVLLRNQTPDEQLLVLERTAWSDQAATAAEVITLQAFRDLFSSEVLRTGEEISVGSLTVLFTDLRDSTRLYREIGDAPAFGRVLDHFDVLRRAVAAEGGAVVKTIGDAIMAAFQRPAPALLALLSAQQQLASGAPGGLPLQLKAGIHHGPCIAVTLNERLDYFGSTVNMAARLERFSSGADVIVSDAVREDPEVREMLLAGMIEAHDFQAPLKGFDGGQFSLWRVERRRAAEAKGSMTPDGL